MYPIHVVCLSVRQAFANYFFYNNAGRFLILWSSAGHTHCAVSAREAAPLGLDVAPLGEAAVLRWRRPLQGVGWGCPMPGRAPRAPLSSERQANE